MIYKWFCLWSVGKLCTCENTTLVQTHTVLVNSKVFPKYDVGWNCLLVCPISLNGGFTNLQKATWLLFGGWVHLTNSVMSL